MARIIVQRLNGNLSAAAYGGEAVQFFDFCKGLRK
jgi:hypothetical protein